MDKKLVNTNLKHFLPNLKNKLVFKLQRRYERIKSNQRYLAFFETALTILVHGLLLNAGIAVLTSGFFPFTIFTIIGWGGLYYILCDYPEYIVNLFKK